MIKKIVNKNLPIENAFGQYNFDETLESVSVDGDQSLYSLVDVYDQNILNIDDYSFIDSAVFTITKADIIKTNVGNTSSYNNDFRVYFIDDQKNLYKYLSSYVLFDEETGFTTYANGTYSQIQSCVKGQLGRWYDNLDGGEHFGCASWWEPGDVVNWSGSTADDACELWHDDLFGGEVGWFNWNEWVMDTLEDEAIDPDSNSWNNQFEDFPYGDDSDLSYSNFIYNKFPRTSGEYYYIAIWAQADDNDGLDEYRLKTYTIYPIPKKLLIDFWGDYNNTNTTLNINFTGGEYSVDLVNGNVTIPRPPYTTGGYGISPKYKGGDLSLSIELDTVRDLSQRDNWADYRTGDYSRINPSNPIDYQHTFDYNNDYITNNSNLDFRPISFVSPQQSWEFDLQQFYEFGNGYIATTSPNTVNLSFRIAEPEVNWYPEYLDGHHDENTNLSEIDIVLGENGPLDSGINFMMYVYDWDAQDMEIDWNYITNDFPSSYTDLVFKQRRGIYDFQRLFKSMDGLNWELGSIAHQYSTAGVKIIKAVVFSYVPAAYEFPGSTEDYGSYITPLRWKAVNIKINMGYDLSFIEDFSDVGGFDYTFIPWPETTAVISGISKDSSYVNAVKEIIQENLFGETEYQDYSLTHLAYENVPGRKKDEIGNYIGKTDLSQIRYFDKPYDMNDLLMLDDTNGFVRYDNFDEWYSMDEETYIDNGKPQYPRNENDEVNSCVGLLFIREDSNISRMESCIIELNFKSVNGITVRDTSGNDNRGLLIGDYVINKPDYNIKLNREEAPEISEINSEKLSF